MVLICVFTDSTYRQVIQLKFKLNNIYDLIPDDLSTEKFETLIDHAKLRIERIVSRGHHSPESGWYDQDDNEWVIVLSGEAVLRFESGDTVHLKSGDYINIEAHQKHKVEWTLPDIETIWLAVHY